ncbi:glycosyltransferase family 4 protein [Rhodopirellula europaea]|uniref:Glycosyltransferase n=1 Tax=Rhodopirellula europaea 6C TaxID=1263867 RepID=M2B6A6_9BACT|nr:glycosyltransferase family 4 protein [Rhodopirellula europaea]EMB17744.1 glycosyltransferase [Rhodopirellula europaea 6C]
MASLLCQRGWQTRSIYGYGVFDQSIPAWHLRKLYRFACRAKRAVTTAMLPSDSPVLLQRLAIPTWGTPESILCGRNNKIVFDFDDAIFMDPYLRESRSRRSALNRIFDRSAHVVAGNQWLASHVKADTPVSVIPTCIDTDRYVPISSHTDRPIRIGWMGTATNLRFLEQLVPAITELRKKHDFEFCLCSDVQNDGLLNKLGASFERWSPEREIEILQSFEVGLMPLSNQDWSRGKCAFKLIQYQAVGIATVSSAIGMNEEVVTDGENGFLAHNENWAEPLDQLLSDGDLRARMGTLARQTAVERYSLPVAADAYESIFDSLICR